MNAYCGLMTAPSPKPSSSEAVEQAELIAAAERALLASVAAYTTADPEAMMRAFASDAVVEYALEEPSAYVLVDVARLIAAATGASAPPRSEARISNLWITPTRDRKSVFAHYTLSADPASSADFPDSEHLVLIEMRGDRIARIRDFSADSAIAPDTRASAAAKELQRSQQ